MVVGIAYWARSLAPSLQGHLYLKSTAMRGNRPAGCVIMDVEVVALDPCRGPGTPGTCLRALQKAYDS